MRSACLLAAVALAAGACSSIPRLYGDGVAVHTLLSGGYAAVNHDTFDGHPVAALEFATSDPANGWGYELRGSYGSEDDDGPRSDAAEFDEVSLGLRRTWNPEEGATRVYVGFGGSVTRLEHTLQSPASAFDDHGGGAYVHSGVLWNLGRYDFDRGTEVLVGVDVRGLVGDDYDSAEVALVLGFGG